MSKLLLKRIYGKKQYKIFYSASSIFNQKKSNLLKLD